MAATLKRLLTVASDTDTFLEKVERLHNKREREREEKKEAS